MEFAVSISYTCAELLVHLLVKFINLKSIHDKWIPYHDCMARPQIADGGNEFRINRIAACRPQRPVVF
jgi:hypothetical protein